VDGGPVLRRFRPMSMGRAGRIRRRTSHLKIVIEDREK
jgi:large subunit ribosomal protein L22